jgi:hypothetical protein
VEKSGRANNDLRFLLQGYRFVTLYIRELTVRSQMRFMAAFCGTRNSTDSSTQGKDNCPLLWQVVDGNGLSG